MPYDPATGNQLSFQFNGAYAPPDGDFLHFGATYIPMHGDRLRFYFVQSYTPPAGDAIHFGGEPVDPPDPEEPKKQSFTPDTTIPWGRLPEQDSKARSGWAQLRPIHASISMPVRSLPKKEKSLRISWKQLEKRDFFYASGWGEYSKRETQYSLSWHALAILDHQRSLPWGKFTPMDRQCHYLLWANPPGKDFYIFSPFCQLDLRDALSIEIPWNNPAARDRLHDTVWGNEYYQQICFRKYEAKKGDCIRMEIDVSLSQIGDRDHVDFFFDQWAYDLRCHRQEPSGWRDAYFYIKPQPGPVAPSKGYYHVLNTALLTRLPDRAAIDVGSITLSTDVDSFCWSFAADLRSQAALELLRNISQPLDVEVNINGYLWIIQVERWTEGSRFIGSSRGVSGRSLSANLATPYGPLITRTEDQARSAVQLAEEALANISGWTLDWQVVDWLVPGGLWSAAEQTPMQIIQDIAQAAHGFVQSHATLKKIMVKPRYKNMPWNWAQAAPELTIPEAMILSTDGSRQPKAQYNAAFVSGTATGGITAKVLRSGTAGDQAAPMFTHALISDTDVALAKGRGLIAASGDWEQRLINIPLFPSQQLPGLVLPGTILKVTRKGGGWWIGQVIGTSITASRGKSGVSVRQSLTVERYHGN